MLNLLRRQLSMRLVRLSRSTSHICLRRLRRGGIQELRILELRVFQALPKDIITHEHNRLLLCLGIKLFIVYIILTLNRRHKEDKL